MSIRPLPEPCAGQPIQEGDYPKIHTGRIRPAPDLSKSPFESSLFPWPKGRGATKRGSFRLVHIKRERMAKGEEQFCLIRFTIGRLRCLIELGLTDMVADMGWWPVLYGMDIWVGRVPLIRTMIALNVLMWIAMWMILR